MQKRLSVLAALGIAALPTAAWANAGTPLMWAGMLHLVFGNLLIGLLEGYLLARIFGLRRRKTIGLLILANYFSAWVGGLFLRGAIVHALPLTLYNAWFFFWVMVLVTYLMTLALEFPFIAFALRPDPRWLSKSIRGSLVVQTVSYGLLFGWYWMASGTSLYTQTQIVPLSAISLPERVLLYFIAAEDGNVYWMNLGSTETRKVFDLKSTDSYDRLFVEPSSTDSNRWDLSALLVTPVPSNPKRVVVAADFAAEAAPTWRSLHMTSAQHENPGLNFGPAARLGSAKNSPWDFWTGFYPIEGLQGSQTNKGLWAGFAFETPFGSWIVCNATLLPSDKVLFQLGRDQICVFDPVTSRVALVVKGWGPIAVMEDNRPQPSTPEAAAR